MPFRNLVLEAVCFELVRFKPFLTGIDKRGNGGEAAHPPQTFCASWKKTYLDFSMKVPSHPPPPKIPEGIIDGDQIWVEMVGCLFSKKERHKITYFSMKTTGVDYSGGKSARGAHKKL